MRASMTKRINFDWLKHTAHMLILFDWYLFLFKQVVFIPMIVYLQFFPDRY
jgi:hypothetical protein